MVRAVTPIPFVKARFFDRCGKPLAGGKVYTYEANTTTPKVTYKDPYGLTPNTNPIILDAAGEADIYLDGTYRIRITDRNDVLVNNAAKIGSWFSDNLQDTLDNISGAMDDALKPVLQNLDNAINAAAAAGAGANGWTDLFITNIDKKPLRDVNIEQVSCIADLVNLTALNNRTIQVKSYYNGLNIGGGVFTLINTAQVVDNGIVFASQDATKKWLRLEQTYLTPDMFGAKPNDPAFDNTDALNKAFATGRTIYGKKDDVYYVDGILNTKGQQLIGGLKISTSRYNLGVVSTEAEPVDSASIRMLYLESAYDFSELLYIKSLGFNTINHYGYFANNGTIDANGTMSQLLDNAKTAGLQVNMGTESDEAKNDLTLFVRKYDSHPSVWGYSVYDEPATRGFTVAQQDDKINQLRAVTTKKLTFVDLVVDNSPFQQKFSQNYDIAFVNSYALKRTSGTFDEKVSLDLDSMRRNYGFVKGMTKLSRIIPVIGSYLDSGANYTNDVDRIIATSEVYATVDEGNFGAFVWDGVGDPSITGNVRNNQKIKSMIKRITAQRTRKKIATDVYFFGGGGTDKNWGLTNIIGRIVKTDLSTTDDKLNLNAYPIDLRNGVTETDRQTSLIATDQYFSGIGFKGDWAAITTDIKYRKKTVATLRFRNFSGATDARFVMFRTGDGGYTFTPQFIDSTSTDSKAFEFVTRSPNPDDTIALLIINQGDTTTKYRKLLFGAIVCTDW